MQSTSSPQRSSGSAHSSHGAAIKRAEWLSRIMDSAVRIPRTNFRIGLDPLVGLIPGIGDGISMLVATLLVVDAARAGVSNVILFRMLSNILVDSLVGAVPLFGDFFDFAWKANSRNLELLRGAEVKVTSGESAAKRVRVMALAVIGVFALVLLAIIAAITAALYRLLF